MTARAGLISRWCWTAAGMHWCPTQVCNCACVWSFPLFLIHVLRRGNFQTLLHREICCVLGMPGAPHGASDESLLLPSANKAARML